MCELLAMSSSRPAQLTLSLATLSSHSGIPDNSRDGWGAAFYQDSDVALFREPSAAQDSALVRFLGTHGPRTALAISHIRHATRGVVALENTQPFVRVLVGRAHVFAHNGNLPLIEQDERFSVSRYRPIGTTDSEHAFCALLARIDALWDTTPSPPRLEDRLSVVAAFAADLRTLGPANFLYADGETLFAHGHRRIQPATGVVAPPGLWLLSRRCALADEPIHASGVSVGPGFQDLQLVASVPLGPEAWRPFAEGELLALAMGKITATMTVAATSAR